MNERALFRRVALHFAMGATLGALFAAVLLALNARRILDVVMTSTNPAVVIAVLIVGASGYFAFGAAITGFYFLIMEGGEGGNGPR